MHIEELYVEVLEEGRIERIEQATIPFSNFNFNLSGALLLPTLKYGSESDKDTGPVKVLLLQGLMITQIITSLETYYRDIFIIITNSIKTTDVEPIALSHFIRENRFMKEFVQAIENENNLSFTLSKLIPESFPLQQKDKIKVAMELIGLNPALREKEWADTFGDHKGSTVKQRHLFIHSGINLGKLSTIIDFFSDSQKG